MIPSRKNNKHVLWVLELKDLDNCCRVRKISFEIAADVQAGIAGDQHGSCLTDQGESEDVVAGCIARQQLIDSFFAK